MNTACLIFIIVSASVTRLLCFTDKRGLRFSWKIGQKKNEVN